VSVPVNLILSNLRADRDEYLRQTDPWMANDRGLTQEQTDELLAYRQALRDFPATVDLEAIVWPSMPSWMV
jgi:hypothetical protein